MLQKSLHHEDLTHMITRFGRAAMENRQISKRLRALLPERLASLKRSCQESKQVGAGAAERHALASPDYQKLVDELANLSGDAHQARVQYETHLMLVFARQSMRKR